MGEEGIKPGEEAIKNISSRQHPSMVSTPAPALTDGHWMTDTDLEE